MFDIGFLELATVMIVGLLVIGPERLPGAIKTGVIWFSRLKRSLSDARAEFEQQIGADEIRREIHNEQVMESMKQISEARASLEEKINDFKNEVEETAQSDSSEADDIDHHYHESDADSDSKSDSQRAEQQEEQAKLIHGGIVPEQSSADEPHEPMIDDDTEDNIPPHELPGRREAVEASEAEPEPEVKDAK